MDDIRQYTYRNHWPAEDVKIGVCSWTLSCEWHWAFGPTTYIGGPLEHRRAIRASKLTDDDKAVALAAVEAFDAARPGRITPASLEPFRVACTHRLLGVNEYAFLLLVRFARHADAAGDLLRSLMEHRDAKVRANVLFYLNRRVPPDLAAKLVRRGLEDRSARVRDRAALAAERCGLVELHDELVSHGHAFSAAMLRPGHLVEQRDGYWSLTVRYSGGLNTRQFDHEPTERDIQAAKAELAEEERQRKSVIPRLPPGFE